MCSSTEVSSFISILKYCFFSINLFTSVYCSKWSRRVAMQLLVLHKKWSGIVVMNLSTLLWLRRPSETSSWNPLPVGLLDFLCSVQDNPQTLRQQKMLHWMSSWMNPTYLLTIQPSFCKLWSSNSSQTDRLSSQQLGIDWTHNLLYLLVNKLQLLIQNWTELNTTETKEGSRIFKKSIKHVGLYKF